MRHLFVGLAVIGSLAVSTVHGGEKGEFFNGKNLDGFEGIERLWSVKDGAIVGQHAQGGLKGFNTFLCSKKKYKDFELQFQVKMTQERQQRHADPQQDPRPEEVRRQAGRSATWAARTGAAFTANNSAA